MSNLLFIVFKTYNIKVQIWLQAFKAQAEKAMQFCSFADLKQAKKTEMEYRLASQIENTFLSQKNKIRALT